MGVMGPHEKFSPDAKLCLISVLNGLAQAKRIIRRFCLEKKSICGVIGDAAFEITLELSASHRTQGKSSRFCPDGQLIYPYLKIYQHICV